MSSSIAYRNKAKIDLQLFFKAFQGPVDGGVYLSKWILISGNVPSMLLLYCF